MPLTYIPPEPPPRPFLVGDVVEIMSRNHDVMSTQVISHFNGKRGYFKTQDGRTWHPDGRWFDVPNCRVYEFPWIRLAVPSPS